MSDETPRRAIADLRRGEEVCDVRLAGRVLSLAPGHFVLADDGAAVEVEAASLPQAGDIIEVRGVWRAGRVRAGAVVVLTPHRGVDPFPSPGGEYYRLRSGPRPRVEALRLRGRCLAALRSFFDRRGYLEVQTPLRVRCPGIEPHLRAEPAGADLYLITSPEYQLKRLLAAGLERIYFLGPCWRGDELGRHHLGEFCMLEWYRAHCSLDGLMVETEELLAHTAREVLGGTTLRYQGRALRLEPPFERLTVAEACRRFAGVELAGVISADEIRRRAVAAGYGPFAPDERFDAVVSRILVERVEPALAELDRPTLLHSFPAPLAALSRISAEDPTVAERFELYAGGLELANAFGELTDAEEQRRRLEEDQEARRSSGAPVTPVDERFVAALAEGIPPSAGIALGVDRLVMLLADAADIRETVAFAPDEL
jgi:elongation factor P--(R)-beta-lysine ligase